MQTRVASKLITEQHHDEKNKFSIPIHGEDFVKKSIGKKWRDYKCDLKAMYVTKYKTKDALIKKKRPSHIPRD
ncbi:hypothetical protein H5410_021281 [Solanum commersonii]|uniref:Uncharacterized protein n=1 Tax=Solanum commersonii TaxID=4109 RepID=A0A9J5ZDT4_SOLCO|nr:hypothetical protein H5410_021281 [Solanum commersonii]